MGKRLRVACLLLLIAGSALAQSIEVSQIEFKRDRGYDYIDVYTTGWSEAKGLLLEDKLYLDFPGARISAKTERALSRLKRSKRVKEVEAVQKDADTARIIVTLKKDKEIEYDIVNVFGQNKSVIEIGDRTDNIYANQFAWESADLKKKAPPLKPVKLEPMVIPKKDLSLRVKTIILDPGHGGDDPGAVSNSGIPEKSLTLQTAQRVGKLLREMGATVILTRDEDRRSNLKDVAEFANKTAADIFISIHFNSILMPKIAGTETYYYNPISKRFAEKMHEAVVRGIKRKDHGLHRTPFYVIKNTAVPSVLLEPVYLTNPEENDLAKSPAFQEKLAESIVKGVKDYFRSRPD